MAGALELLIEGVGPPLPRDAPRREGPEHAEDRGILPLAPQDHGEVRPRPAVFPRDFP